MARESIWLNEIVDTMCQIGGHGYYKDIYDKMEERAKIDLFARKDWQAQVRGTIERFSSDSKVYTGNTDKFYAVDGIGNGHWGLRDYEPSGDNVDITEDDGGFQEGKKALRLHICRERNAGIIKKSKEKFIFENGKLFCEACSFCFEEKYGELGVNFIEGHHIIPVSKIPFGYKTKVEDIVMLCSNCHKMIHRKRPWITKSKLKEIIKR